MRSYKKLKYFEIHTCQHKNTVSKTMSLAGTNLHGLFEISGAKPVDDLSKCLNTV